MEAALGRMDNHCKSCDSFCFSEGERAGGGHWAEGVWLSGLFSAVASSVSPLPHIRCSDAVDWNLLQRSVRSVPSAETPLPVRPRGTLMPRVLPMLLAGSRSLNCS